MKKITVLFLFCFTCCIVTKNNPILLLANEPNSIHWGVNIHTGGSDALNLANKISDRNLKYVRMDYWGKSSVSLAKFIDVVKILNSENINIQAIVYSDFSAGQFRNEDYNANLTEVEQKVYDDTKPQIESVKEWVLDFELQNEIPLYQNMNISGTTGQNSTDYNTPAGRLQAAVLRGMSRAIDDVRNSSGLPIRIILGTVDRRYGFLTFMQQQGVLFDVVGYHIYPWEMNEPLDEDTWFGQGGALGQLAKFNMPVHINEFNAGEIYSGGPNHPGTNYENRVGQPMTETGFRSIYKHLNVFVNQRVVNIESVHFYEIADEIQKNIPENRFGLYYDTNLQSPKISLLLATAFAGGKLTPAENDSLLKRNFTYYNTLTGLSNTAIETETHVKLFPNPVINNLTIKSEKIFNSINIYNSCGVKLFSHKVDEFNYTTSIDLSDYPSGIYIVGLKNNELNIFKRIIKK